MTDRRDPMPDRVRRISHPGRARETPFPDGHRPATTLVTCAMLRADISCRCIGVIHRIERKPLSAEVAENVSSNRSGVLELAVLGLLHEPPMHGYELRK